MRLVVLAVFSALMITGCSHTNNLAEYDVKGKTCLFRNIVEPEAQQVEINIATPSTGNVVGDIIVAVGEGAISNEAYRKLERAIKPGGVAASISAELEQAMKTYLLVDAVSKLTDETAFIVETRLRECELRSSGAGVFVVVGAEAAIYDRASGNLVWEYSAREDLPIRRSVVPPVDPVTHTTAGIISAVQLTQMSEEEIQEAVQRTAAAVGRELADVLREDVSEQD